MNNDSCGFHFLRVSTKENKRTLIKGLQAQHARLMLVSVPCFSHASKLALKDDSLAKLF